MTQPSAVHVNDAAFTAQRLITQARRQGLAWDFLPKAAPAQSWTGLTGKARRALIGGSWVAKLAVAARRHDIVHVHSASTLGHTRLGAPRFVLHCHGSDVRTTQYQPKWTATIQNGLKDAEAVFYSTPDIAEHVLPHRSDAVYLPVPIDVDAIAPWTPSDGKPTVFFASRWTPDKDSAAQVELARELVEAVGDKAEVVGLDWGDDAPEAAKAGVRLVPRGDHPAYLRMLSEAHVVVGQSAGILAASELEAMAAGTPFVIPVALPLYDSSPPVLGGTAADAVSAVVSLVEDPSGHDPDASRTWVRKQYGVEQAVDTVAGVYRDVVAARS